MLRRESFIMLRLYPVSLSALVLAVATMPALAQNPYSSDPRYQGFGRDPMVTASTPPRGSYGGGFIEMLMTGQDPTSQRSGVHYQQPPTHRAATNPYQNAPERMQRPLGRQQAIDPMTGEPAVQMAARTGSDQFERPIERVLDPRFRKQEVAYDGGQAPGTIVIDTTQRFLFHVQTGGRAMRYGIGVGRPGFEWAGRHSVTRKAEWPDWTPPSEMLKRRPDLPRFMKGGEDNPMGARAMYLGSSLYRIHGTNEPHTIGQAVSSGCIRMTNDDVTDLYERVRVGARVIVM
jgi:lipoprotein-anchoring transpeptidase ErfK/SrfK